MRYALPWGNHRGLGGDSAPPWPETPPLRPEGPKRTWCKVPSLLWKEGRGKGGAHPGRTGLLLYPSPFARRVSRTWHLSAGASMVGCTATAPSPPRWRQGSQCPRLGRRGLGDLGDSQGGGWAERTATSIFPAERRENRRRGPGETPPPLRPEAARTRRATRLRPPERFHKSGRWQAAN